jgi:hypothetical protein
LLGETAAASHVDIWAWTVNPVTVHSILPRHRFVRPRCQGIECTVTGLIAYFLYTATKCEICVRSAAQEPFSPRRAR